jgi:polynucleotide 5'-hydroxyl-kinase GRC3/NOL9
MIGADERPHGIPYRILAAQKAEGMVENWAEMIADRIVGDDSLSRGKVLFLGAADTGKTTLMSVIAARLARRRPVALVDADVGQSHIGPPTTVGWTMLDGTGAAALASGQAIDASCALAARGIAFVGDITPVGHLLQLTAAVSLCVEQAQRAAAVVLIDTPGLVTGPAACSLWWTAQRLLRPERIIAVQRQDELRELLGGLQAGLSALEVVPAPPELRRKSPQARQQHRRRLFDRYFQDAATCTLDLARLAVRTTGRVPSDDTTGHLVGLTDVTGQDMAIGAVARWRQEQGQATIRAPQVDLARVRCLTVGRAKIDTSFGWS